MPLLDCLCLSVYAGQANKEKQCACNTPDAVVCVPVAERQQLRVLLAASPYARGPQHLLYGAGGQASGTI